MIAELLPKIAAMEQEDQAYRRRPSAAGPERCIRQSVYHARGDNPAPFPGRTMLVFDDGNWHEELTLDWIRKTSFQVHSQQMEVVTRCGAGHIDGIVTDLLGVDRLLEHKAINHFSFQRMWEAPTTGNWPLDYFTQVALYLDGLQRVNPDLTEALLLVKNKNTAQYLDIALGLAPNFDELVLLSMSRSDGERYDVEHRFPGILENAVRRFDEIEAHRDAGTLPERPYPYGTNFPCGYCRYARVCWEGYTEQIKERQAVALEDERLRVTLASYVNRKQMIASMEKELDGLKQEIVSSLDRNDAGSIRCGAYLATLRVQKRNVLDRSLLPPEIAERATRESESVALYVKETA